MAQACFDPLEAKLLWMRMDAALKNQGPSFLSTHPTHKDRIRNIDAWMPQALSKYEESGCSSRQAASFWKNKKLSSFHF
jgi:predicted Zn-dependent protease